MIHSKGFSLNGRASSTFLEIFNSTIINIMKASLRVQRSHTISMRHLSNSLKLKNANQRRNLNLLKPVNSFAFRNKGAGTV